jgi:hypothetical protein
MECNQSIAWAAVVQKCKVCRMDLCKKCSKKHNGVCIWCYQHAPDQYIKMKKAADIAMILIPAFILFMPAPMPAVLLIATNTSIIIPMIIYAGAAYIVLGIMRTKAAQKIVSEIPADVEALDGRKTTAAGAQTQTLISHLRVESQQSPSNEHALQAPAASNDLSGPSPSQVEVEGTVTCRNCENVFRRAPGANICPACGFIYRD